MMGPISDMTWAWRVQSLAEENGGRSPQTLERAMGGGRAGSGFKGLWPTLGLGTGVHASVLQSHSSHEGDPEFSERGFFNFCFWKVLSQEGQRLEELLDVAGASETRRPRVFSLPGTQPVPKERDFPEKSASWLL